jgi:hypothetical protein
LHYPQGCVIVKAMDKFNRPAAFRRLLRAGGTFVEIGELFDISRQRVKQLLDEHFPGEKRRTGVSLMVKAKEFESVKASWTEHCRRQRQNGGRHVR